MSVNSPEFKAALAHVMRMGGFMPTIEVTRVVLDMMVEHAKIAKDLKDLAAMIDHEYQRTRRDSELKARGVVLLAFHSSLHSLVSLSES